MKKIYFSFILLIVMWLVYFVAIKNFFQDTESFIIMSVIYIVMPMLVLLIKKEKNEKTIKKVSLINSIIIGFLFLIIIIIFEDPVRENILYFILSFVFVTIISIVYYCINYCFYSKDKRVKTKGLTTKEEFDNKIDSLNKLKKLYDDKVITKEEFKKEKEKILNQN